MNTTIVFEQLSQDITEIHTEFVRYTASLPSFEAIAIEKKLSSLRQDEVSFFFEDESVQYEDEKKFIGLTIEFLVELKFRLKIFADTMPDQILKRNLTGISLKMDDIYYKYRKRLIY